MVDVVVHWAHLMAAIIWVGGTTFLAFVLQPIASRALPTEIRMAVARAVGQRFLVVQAICWGILVATGVFKLWQLREVPEVFYTGQGVSAFGGILAVKLVLVLVVTALTFLHSFVWGPRVTTGYSNPPSPTYLAALRKLVFWGRVNLVLGTSIIFCAALLRFNPF
ncbi:MAG: DUF4149 domain-containing protein [Elusimicrobia bacterium]|nr:DUF4149 domain-containing protein [Elusimicrobiota bacterium]